jgi:hypothetical protein
MNLKAITVIMGALMVAGLRGSETDFWQDKVNIRRLGDERIGRNDFREGLPLLQTALSMDPHSPVATASLANAFHLQRRLDEAAVQYSQLLKLAPPSEPTSEQEKAILRFAPRVFQVPSDPFPLKDVVAIHHPQQPIIAYHFFWSDDIDFPEDNDPCDHELVWVRYNPATQTVTDFHTYFHGRLLHSDAAIQDAHQHQERVRVDVQWGKHGSLPFGWEGLSIQADSGDVESQYLDLAKPVPLEQYNRAAWMKLHNDGRRMANHPLSRAWPRTFEGSWADFIRFDNEIDIRPLLQQRRAMMVSRWNNAVLQQYFLAYNFRPKTEWPDAGENTDGVQLRRAASRPSDRLIETIAGPQRLPDDLPPASLFQPETPRYPNVWFYGSDSEFPTYTSFVEFLGRRFEAAGFSPDAVSLNEGSDIALSIEHLQPWNAVPLLAHAHALHIRFFWKRLEAAKLQQVNGQWRVAASVHYEVEHASPLHADVEVCPICGRTGAYAGKEGSLVEHVHDPVGLELLLWGTVRSEPIEHPEHSKTFPSVDRFLKTRRPPLVAKPSRSDMNTEAMALVEVVR